MKNTHKFLLIVIVVGGCVGCDQVSKNIASNNLKHAEPIVYLDNFFRFQYAENTGAFLSLGAKLSLPIRTFLFTILSGGLLLFLLVYLLKNRHFDFWQVLALSLILGGGSSNLIDRIFKGGRVVDFMNMGIGSLRTGIFNFADVSIMLGMGIIFFTIVQNRSKPNPPSSQAPDAD